MNAENIPLNAFIIKNLGILKYVPEKDVYEEKYNKFLWNKLFTKKNNVDYTKLKLTNIAKYSMANNFIANALEKLIKEQVKLYLKIYDDNELKELTVTESNGGIGGLSIKLVSIFNNLNIVEINTMHANMIKNNLDVYNDKCDNYKNKKINIINDDYLNVLYDLNQDIIVADPPWGGYDYKKFKYMKLSLNNINMSYIINKLYQKNKFKVFILLVMKNFDIQNFVNNIESENIIIRNLGKHYFITILGKNIL
jgi:hypothetical protein